MIFLILSKLYIRVINPTWPRIRVNTTLILHACWSAHPSAQEGFSLLCYTQLLSFPCLTLTFNHFDFLFSLLCHCLSAFHFLLLHGSTLSQAPWNRLSCRVFFISSLPVITWLSFPLPLVLNPSLFFIFQIASFSHSLIFSNVEWWSFCLECGMYRLFLLRSSYRVSKSC